MPRPRKNPNEVLVREIRITPPNQEPIEFVLNDTISKFVAFEEGGHDTGKKLHYHCYIETTMTSQALPKWIYTQASCIETGETGNAVFFSRQPHEHTFGYISKERKCVSRYGFEEHLIDEWFTQSTNYNKCRERERKRGTRTRGDELNVLKEEIKAEISQMGISRRTLCPEDIVKIFLSKCHEQSVRFPTRTQLEHFVIELLYPYNSDTAIYYYSRSFGIR